MLDFLVNFLSFLGRITLAFLDAFFVNSSFLFNALIQAPLANPFETLFALFFVAVILTFAAGTWLAIRRSDFTPFVRTVEGFVRVFAVGGSWLIICLIAAMVFEVLARYLFAAPTQWSYEVSYMLMGTSFMFAVGFCLQRQQHVRVDFLYSGVSRRKRAIIDLVGYLLLLPMILWLCGGLFEYFARSYRVGETSGESAWNPIIWPYKFVLVIGFLLLLFQIVIEVLKAILVLAGRPLPEEVLAGDRL